MEKQKHNKRFASIKEALPFHYDKESQLFRNKNNEYIRMLRIKGINLFGMKEDDQELRMRCFQNLLNPLIGDGQIFSYEIPADVDGYIDDYENMKATLDLQNDYDSSRYEILEENQTRLSETAITRELVDRIFLIILKDKDLARLEQRVNTARDIMQSFNSVYILDTQDMIEVIYNYYNPRNSTYLGEMEEDEGDIMDYIYPDSISYADNKLQQYININDVYCTTLYVSKYTKQNLGFLHILSTYPDVDFSMHFEPAPKNQVKNILDKSLKNTGKNLDNSKPGSEQADLQKQYENLEEIINQINVGDDLPYYFSVSIRLKADSLEGLIDYIKEVKNDLGAVGFKMRSGIFQSLDLFNLTAPICMNNLPNYMKQTTNDTIGWSYPFVYESLYDHTNMLNVDGEIIGHYAPFYLGNTTTTGGVVFYDNFTKQRDRSNYNEFIAGNMGAGKTTLMMALIKYRHAVGYKQFIIDIEGKALNKLTYQLKGSIVDCANGERGRINPLQVRIIVPDDVKMETRKTPLSEIKPLSSHIRYMRSFYNSYNSNPASFTNQHYSILEDSLFNVYANFGIDKSTNALELVNRKPEEYPIFEDQYNELIRMRTDEIQSSLPNMNKINVIDECISFIKPLAIGADAEVFNGITNIDDSSKLICFNLAGLHDNTSSLVLGTQYLNILTFIWSSVASGDGTTRIQIYEDELAVIQDPKFIEVMIMNENMSRRVRKNLCGMTFGTQQLTDVLKKSVVEHSKALMNLACNKFYFALDASSIRYLTENSLLPQSETEAIVKFEIGETFLMVGTHTSMRVKVTLDDKTLEQFDEITSHI